jgi:ferredoxin
MRLKFQLTSENKRRQVIVEGQVQPDSSRCVQCGICSFYCPIGIDVRRHAWLGVPVIDSRCLTCGECVARCPRAVLSFEKTTIFATAQNT